MDACIDEMTRPEGSRIASSPLACSTPTARCSAAPTAFPPSTRALLDLSGIRDRIPHRGWTDALASLLGLAGGRSRFWAHDRTCDVDTFRGAAMLVRREAWLDVGPLSEATRVGGEVAEWHRRCRNRGWRVVFFPGASVVHHGSRTVGRDLLLRSEYLKGYLVGFERLTGAGRPAWPSGGVGAAIAVAHLAAAVATGDCTGRSLWTANVRLLLRGPGARPGHGTERR